ncbi:hypothetical protein [Microvirga massiliensis]|uniref:hypothetical protein n=1 Tax=Microvirga massiliensis TaxID=1033741 RepID=UPI00062B38F3|nr:hypothetical protein [Microvirga massiliensis]
MKLRLASAQESWAIQSMLEGMIEVSTDEGTNPCPVGDDQEAVMDWLIAATPDGITYPVEIPLQLSSEQVEELRAALSNLEDQGDEWSGDDDDAPFTATIIDEDA